MYMKALKYVRTTHTCGTIAALQQTTSVSYKNGSNGVEIDYLREPTVNNVDSATPITASSRFAEANHQMLWRFQEHLGLGGLRRCMDGFCSTDERIYDQNDARNRSKEVQNCGGNAKI